MGDSYQTPLVGKPLEAWEERPLSHCSKFFSSAIITCIGIFGLLETIYYCYRLHTSSTAQSWEEHTLHQFPGQSSVRTPLMLTGFGTTMRCLLNKFAPPARLNCKVFSQILRGDTLNESEALTTIQQHARKHLFKLAHKRDRKREKTSTTNSLNPAETQDVAGRRRRRNGTSSKQPTIIGEMPCPPSENPLHTPPIEVEHVHRVYDAIADTWNHTRWKAWPAVEAFVNRFEPGFLVADLGCGNGKNIPAVQKANGVVIASDLSEPLVRMAKETHGAETIISDCLRTRLRGGVFDAALSIAVMHHLSTKARRVQALREAARLLKPGGEFIVCGWAYEQDDNRSLSRHRFPGQDVLVPWSAAAPGVKLRSSQPCNRVASSIGDKGSLSQQSAGVFDTSLDDAPDVFQRYCHVYQEGELLQLFENVPEFEVTDHWYGAGNWYVTARRRY